MQMSFATDDERFASFARTLDALRDDVEARLGPEDVAHIRRIGRVSRAAEILGRGLIFVSLDPLSFGAGVAALWLHKVLELMEIGHTSLHGTYDRLEGAERYRAKSFYWKAPIDERSWRNHHNGKHHQHANVLGRDPDLDFGGLRLSAYVSYRPIFRHQPLSNFATWLGFAGAINLHVTGLLDVHWGREEPAILHDRSAKGVRAAHRAAFRKFARYYGREYVLLPLLSGPFFWKTLLGNVLSEVGRDVYAAATIYCGHVGATEFPPDERPKGRGAWYAMQAEGAHDFDVPHVVSILCGALDRQIEHHLFPTFPPNRLREITPRVRAACEAHGVRYRTGRWPQRLREVTRTLRELSRDAILGM
ncbi:fatty acid desaturase family protein [Pendulispora albinea]|uniref:Fatty acid desaturase n=1 Tax=Pendulispora albinea TaxID=2741071 RepID=A0ABZ2MAV2_9BACT